MTLIKKHHKDLRSQQLFWQNVYFFICKNIFKYDTVFNIPQFLDDESSQGKDHNETESNQEKDSTNPDSDMGGATDSTDVNKDNQNEATEAVTETPTEPYSLRDWLYDLDDKDGRSLIHAAYKSAQDGKIFVLCEQSNVQQVLHVLHNIVQYSSVIFSDAALATYFGPNKDNPVIINHLRTDS